MNSLNKLTCKYLKLQWSSVLKLSEWCGINFVTENLVGRGWILPQEGSRFELHERYGINFINRIWVGRDWILPRQGLCFELRERYGINFVRKNGVGREWILPRECSHFDIGGPCHEITIKEILISAEVNISIDWISALTLADGAAKLLQKKFWVQREWILA